MSLFDDFQRTNDRPAEAGEPLYAFVNRAAGEGWQSVRDLLTEWLTAYPTDEQHTLISRFRRTDRRGFLGAFWELYLHELFLRLGFRIELHPEVVASTHRPDFRLRREDSVVYVEAVTIYEPQTHSADDTRLAPLLAAVRRISSPRFRVAVDARQVASTPLSLTRLVRELESWLTELETEPFSAPEHALDRLFRWQEDGWMLIFRAIDPSEDRLVLPRPRRAKQLDDYRSIRNRVSGKSRWYGQRFDAPFLIALTSYRPNHGPETLPRALFGSAASDPAMMRAGMIRRSRATSSSGVWLTNKGVQYEDISAVLTAFDILPWSVAHNQPWLIANPWASHPLKIELPFNRFDVDGASGDIERVETGFEPNHVFGLGRDWPPGFGRSGSRDEEMDRWINSN